nr:glycosyltransferase family 4 protein [Bacteroidota bacterium]
MKLLKTNKNILLISPQPFFQWRGSPIRVNYNARALAELGFSVDLLTLPFGEKLKPEGVNVIRVANPFRIRQIPIGPSFYKIVFDFLILVKGLQLIRRNKYSVIHGVEEAGIIAVFLSQLAGSKTIFEKHSDPFSYKKGVFLNMLLRVYSNIERYVVQRVHAVICTGPGLEEQVLKMGKKTPVFNIFDIPSSLKEPLAGEVIQSRNELQKKEDDVLVTFVGSFAHYQGIDLLMGTIYAVVKKCPGVRFIIIGGKDAEIDKWKTILRKQGVLEAVSFTGMVAPDIVPRMLSASDILLSPRKSGVNTPLKLLDYLKAGRSIVATNIESNRLILTDDIAVLTEPDPDSMAAAIISLIENPGQRRTMGQNGRKLYE